MRKVLCMYQEWMLRLVNHIVVHSKSVVSQSRHRISPYLPSWSMTNCLQLGLHTHTPPSILDPPLESMYPGLPLATCTENGNRKGSLSAPSALPGTCTGNGNDISRFPKPRAPETEMVFPAFLSHVHRKRKCYFPPSLNHVTGTERGMLPLSPVPKHLVPL